MPDLHSTVPAWRSLLFVPASRARLVDKAIASGADAVVLDLEDAVAEGDKGVARAEITGLASRLSHAGVQTVVRINRPLDQAVRDIEAVVGPDVAAIMVAKVQGADHLVLLSEVIAARERALGLETGITRLIPLVETAAAVARLDQIAVAGRVVALVCGDEDLAADLGCPPGSETLVSVKHALVLAAARAGVHPLGLMGSIAEFHDLDAYRACVVRSRAAGLRGTLCIHPDQVAPANQGFGPSAAELDHARRVVAAADAALAQGTPVVALEGRMIDAPVVRRARGVLAGGEGLLASRNEIDPA